MTALMLASLAAAVGIGIVMALGEESARVDNHVRRFLRNLEDERKQ